MRLTRHHGSKPPKILRHLVVRENERPRHFGNSGSQHETDSHNNVSFGAVPNGDTEVCKRCGITVPAGESAHTEEVWCNSCMSAHLNLLFGAQYDPGRWSEDGGDLVPLRNQLRLVPLCKLIKDVTPLRKQL